MFGATTNYPFNFSNRFGIPMIESANVTIGTEDITINLPNRVFRALSANGVVAFRLNTEIPAASNTLPIMFSSNEFTQAVTLVGGDAATGAQMGQPGIYLLWYDKNCNLMQLLTFQSA